MEIEKLLPCPFCGTENVEGYRPALSNAWAVHCDDCDFKGPHAYSKAEAIAAWNTRAPAEQTGWRDIETAPKEGFIVGGFFTDAGTRYAQPVVLVCRERDHPSRTEYYAGKQRMFPTHFLTFSPDLAPGTTRAPAGLRSALEAETIERCAKVCEQLAAGCRAELKDPANETRTIAVMDGHISACTTLAANIRALAPTKGDVS